MKKVDLSLYFESVDRYLETSDGQHTLTLCHYPQMSWNHRRRSLMIHGHIHENTDMDYWPLILTRDNLLNASCDINNYEPVTFEELIENNIKFKPCIHNTIERFRTKLCTKSLFVGTELCGDAIIHHHKTKIA